MLKLQQNSDIWQIYCIKQPKISLILNFNYVNQNDKNLFANIYGVFFCRILLLHCIKKDKVRFDLNLRFNIS
ncbi:hypothetical protein BpHYR1_010784 [Brachionus plicatilis]|uniref:Uncharacterized protein n=1 Tax=Brachionus plicatilis TaxID=10195 RepID=A0A3M7QW49_BRAPC|nr:hypothetical protein BpHYR1_010784 [Brachionus plicatilis]